MKDARMTSVDQYIERLRDEMFVVHRKGFLRICHFSRLVLSLLEDFRKVGIEG